MARKPLPMVNRFILPQNGIVQPAVKPPEYRTGRRTNQLEYFGDVIDMVWQNSFSAVFRYPVNSIESNLPTYHSVIQYPMDLNTIRLRLENKYYWCVDEAIKDVHLMLDNCAKFNAPGGRVYKLGIKVRNFFNSKMELMPIPEIDLENNDADNTEKKKKHKKIKEKVKLMDDEEQYEKSANQPMDLQIDENVQVESMEIPIDYSELPDQKDVDLCSHDTDEMQIKIEDKSLAFESMDIPSIENKEETPNRFSDPIFREQMFKMVEGLVSLGNDINSLANSLEEVQAEIDREKANAAEGNGIEADEEESDESDEGEEEEDEAERDADEEDGGESDDEDADQDDF